MKISLTIAALVVSICALSYMMRGTNSGRDRESEAAQSTRFAGELTEETDMKQDAAQEIDDAGIENRRNDMMKAYSQLQQSREKLKSHANLLKSKIWGLELPTEQARSVSRKMHQAYAYLKNPPMLGAYFELDEIRRESRKVKAMRKELMEVEQTINVSQSGDQ